MATAQAVRTAQDQQQKQGITLQGSAQLIGEYLYHAINSILYMRGVYPPDMFEDVEKYGMSIFDAKDDQLKSYLNSIMKWVTDWMMQEAVTAIVLVIVNPDTKEVVERWSFEIVCDKSAVDENGNLKKDPKDPKKSAIDIGNIRRQIGSVLKQIVASVSLLPATAMDAVCSFNILVYTKDNLDVPADWQESNPHLIPNAQQLKFRKIDTNIHKVDTCVTYRAADFDL